MNRAILSEQMQLQEKLQGYIGMMFIGYANMCVKVEPVSLLTISVNVEGELKNLEEVATIGQKNEYQLMIIPHIDEDLLAIGQGIFNAHPEFKQEQEKMEVDMPDGKKHSTPYILVTMPEVDKNRRDVLKQAADALYNDTKVKMETAITKSDAKIASMSVNEKPEDVNNIKESLKEKKEMWNKHRDQMHDDKLKEIEDGYQHYLQQQAAQKSQQANQDASKVTSMQLPKNE